MAEEYPKEELQKIYEALPDDLKEALFSEKTAGDIYDVCVENGLEEKNLELAKYVGYVLLGLLSPNEFEKTLKEKLTITNDLAKKISQEIIRLVFIPLRTSLEALYKIKMIKIVLPPSPETVKPSKELPEEEISKEENPIKEKPEEKMGKEEISREENPTKEEPEKRMGKDVYRETIE